MNKLEKDRFGVVNWRRAKGVKHHRGETNSALAERNYEIPCKHGPEPITIFEGYHVWWCVPHHQPLAWCEKARVEIAFDGMAKLLVRACGFQIPRELLDRMMVKGY